MRASDNFGSLTQTVDKSAGALTSYNCIKFPFQGWSPYPHQVLALDAFFKKGIRNQIKCIHRRGGKDALDFNTLQGAALIEPGLYLYLFPEAKQLKKAIWRAVDPTTGQRIIDKIPRQLLAREPNNSDLYCEYKNGAIIQFAGTDNYRGLLGLDAKGALWSEFQDHNPGAYEAISPMLLRHKGFNLINGTCRGKQNHFYHKFHLLEKNPRWFSQYLNIEQTFKHDGSRIFTDEDIELVRAEGISEESIRQEYYCDWDVGMPGAYYSREMERAQLEGRICNFEFNPNALVYTAWDIGYTDSTAIWFYQFNPQGHIDLIYYLEGNEEGPPYYAKQLQDLAYQRGFKYPRLHGGPHDLEHKTFACPRGTLAECADAGIFFEVGPKLPILEGIQAARSLLPYCRFHVEHCALGINALREYKRKWDPINKIYAEKPTKSWANHGADAFRYLAVAQRKHLGSTIHRSPGRYEVFL